MDDLKESVIVDNPSGLSGAILVNNTLPEGSLDDIVEPSQAVTACGFLKLP